MVDAPRAERHRTAAAPTGMRASDQPVENDGAPARSLRRHEHADGLIARIGRKETRRLRARRRKDRAPWIALGLYGVVGWSIVLPTLAGIALGVWIDATWPSRYSWTLMLLALGLCVGCWNAWRWVSLEQQAIRDEQEEGRDVPERGND